MLEDRREGRFEVVVARRWDFEQLLFDRLRGVLQVAQFLPCVMVTARRQAGEQDMTLHLTRMKQKMGRVSEVLARNHV